MLRNLATIMIRPRATMRRILDDAGSRAWLGMLLLASISAGFGDFDRTGFDNIVRAAKAYGIPAVVVILAMILAIVVSMSILFYVFSWAAWGIGKALEGTGSPGEVRRAFAWGLAPIVWALLYRVPVAIFWEGAVKAQVSGTGSRFTFDPGKLGDGCLMTLIVGVLELIAFVWCIAVSSNTVGEAHRFSSWRGLATIVLTSIAPLILVVAAVLAM
ncbi:MAG TPA: Yip1 family protein [Thermoanaerobaculia bacterium]|nr:Yip1 family protein [Thermoanaerobaculia bacterium]